MKTYSVSFDKPIILGFLLLTSLWEWLYHLFRPDQNAGNWFAAAVGAFVIRLVLPKISPARSVAGWFTGFVVACLFASSVVKAGILALEPFAVWALVALLGDLVLQVLGWIVKLVQKLGGYTYEHPDQAFDNTLDKVEKVTSVWVRIKVPFMELLDLFKAKKP